MNAWTYVVGWTLIHFAWQGTVLTIVTAGLLRCCQRQSPNVRYVVACVSLLAMLASAGITAGVLIEPDVVSTPLAGESQINTIRGAVLAAVSSWTNDGVAPVRPWTGLDAMLTVIAFLWLGGVTALMVRMTAGLWHVRRVQVKALASPASRWQRAAERIASRLGLRVAVHVVESAHVDVPTALGWLRPVILLPVAALANLSPSQVEAILVHELIHIRRHDYLVNIVQRLAETFLFYHPGVWWVSAQIRAEREHCCDDVAVEVCGDPVEYAAALAELEAWRSSNITFALAATDGSLIGRVRRVLNVPIGHEARSLGWVVPLAVTFACVVIGGGIYVSSEAPRTGPQSHTNDSGQATDPIASPDTFDWQVQKTDHFDIYYYPALTPNLEPAAHAAERAYQWISAELQYNLPFSVPLILFNTRDDFQQQTIVPEAREAIIRGQVTSFSEPKRSRVVILIEEDPDRLYQRITHELTHVFAFEIIPRSGTNVSRVPTWIDEGLAEYMTQIWDPADLDRLRELVSAGSVPTMTALTVSVDDRTRGAAADLGHAVFEFIEAEYGKPAVWQFLLEVRRNVVEGSGDLYQTAFNRTPEEFDAAFAQHLRTRFSR